MREEKSFCRICAGFCGMVLSIDDAGRIAAIRGDKDHPLTRGYACIKGLQAPEAHNGPSRLLHPLKRMDDGSFSEIPLDQALDEIAAKLGAILDRDGPEALATFRGTINVFSAVSSQMLTDWLAAFGSTNFYSTMTIDQSAKWVTIERLGMWAAGRQALADADVWMLIGTNPLVSIGSPGLSSNPSLTMREAKARGMKLIVIDPRRSETASHADLFLQPRPGEDPTIAAGLLNIILKRGWEDSAFCEAHVEGLDALRAAVSPFSPDYVAARAGVPAADLIAAAEMFAGQPRRGIAHAGTGVTMAPHSNLADHLYDCLNVVCGRFLRAGEVVGNPGALGPSYPRHAEVFAPRRSFESGPRSRIGRHGMLFGEKMTGVLADEILTPGPGQVRALFVDGGNPASAIPDQIKLVEALRSLELLVTIDPAMTTTARLSHYVLPPKVFYEHGDLPPPAYETSLFARPFAAYTPAVSSPPEGADVADDWYMLWSLASRLGRTVVFNGVALDPNQPPTDEQLHALVLRGAMTPFETMKAQRGELIDLPPEIVQPARAEADGRFEVAPADVLAELAAVRGESEPASDDDFPYRLVARRMREVSNSMYHDFPAVRRRLRYNPAYLHPEDLVDLGVGSGDRVRILSDHGVISAIVEADPDIRRGVVSMAHSWGGLPDDACDYLEVGAYTGLLISTGRDVEALNGMPRQSAIPVRLERG